MNVTADYSPKLEKGIGVATLLPLVSRSVLTRAGVVAVLLGSVLTIANQSDALLGSADIQMLPLFFGFRDAFHCCDDFTDNGHWPRQGGCGVR